MKQHIVYAGVYYYALPVASRSGFWGTTVLQFRTNTGDLFVDSARCNTFPTRLEAYRFMFFNVDLTRWYHSRRICYSYDKLTRIMLKHFPEDFL